MVSSFKKKKKIGKKKNLPLLSIYEVMLKAH